MGIPEKELRAALEGVTGETALLASDVDWDLKTPCNDCPFLRTSPYHEGVAGSLPGYADSIQDHRFAHTCHKTDCRPTVDGPRTFKGTAKHCAGALMMLLKTGNGVDLQVPLLEALQADKWDYKEMETRAQADDRVFRLPELLEFYAIELGKRVAVNNKRKLRKQRRKQAAKRKPC